MKDKSKTIILIILIIAVAVFLTWFSYNFIENGEKQANNNTNKNEIIANVTENNSSSSNKKEINKEETKQENVEQKNENKEEEKKEENTIQNKAVETNEEKAINAVKKAWGSEDGVYFSCMGIDTNGRYIVSINDSTTSAVYGWYNVDIQTGEVKEQ